MITREAKRKLRVPLRTFSSRGGLLAYLEALKMGVARLQKRLLMLLVYLESGGWLDIAFIARARNKMIDCCACSCNHTNMRTCTEHANSTLFFLTLLSPLLVLCPALSVEAHGESVCAYNVCEI